MIREFVDWYLSALADGGYGLIALLMAVESSVVPLPSELVIPPAAHLAVAGGHYTLAGIVIAAALGSWIGASAMYGLARYLGRPFLVRYGRYVLVTPAALDGAERWAATAGPYGVFVARLLPVIRHLIGLPAGLVRLSYLQYSLATLAGSALWSVVLVTVGVVAGNDPALVAGDLRRITPWVVIGVAVLTVLYVAFVRRAMRRPND